MTKVVFGTPVPRPIVELLRSAPVVRAHHVAKPLPGEVTAEYDHVRQTCELIG
jgi:hypothetical protein